MTDPETVADVLAEMKQQTRDGWTSDARLCRFADRIERAMAASAVQDDTKDAARFRWLRDHAINTEGAKGSPWCVYGLDLGDCTPAFGAELVAMVDDAMANGIVCSPVPVESLGRDADEVLVAIKRGEGYEDVHPQLVADDAFGETPFAYRVVDSAPPPASVQDVLTADDVQWIVNDNAELGVMIRGQAFFLYKGDSLVYDDAKHDDGTPMYYRTVGKREFGECAYPINHSDYSKQGTVSLDDSDRWQLLPPTTPEESP